MQKYFTSFQIFVAAALGLVVFIGVLWVEQSNFAKVLQLQDPFSKAQYVNERVVVNPDQAQSWLHSTGEIFLVFPGGKFNLLNQARELEEGTLFVNSNFQNQNHIQSAAAGFIAPFDLTSAKLQGGQIRVGPAVVSAPQGIMVVKRDLVRQEAQIYAHDHPVDIYLPGASEAFLLPAGYTVLLKESRAELLSALYYTKLKKELKLSPLGPAIAGADAIELALEQGQEQSKVLLGEIMSYAQNFLLSTTRFAPSSLMGRFWGFLAHLQRYYALGVSQPYKVDYEYQQLHKDLRDAYFALEEGTNAKAVNFGDGWKEKFNSAAWVRFFVENPHYQARWNDFYRLQRVWFYYNFPGNRETIVLRRLWGPSAELGGVEDYQAHYYLFEKYYAQGYRSQAQEQLEFLDREFASFPPPTKADQPYLSRARRQLSFLLHSDIGLRNEVVFNLYTQVVAAEKTALGDDSELAQEIRLEVAQELLFFLKDLLNSSARQDMAIILLRSYRNLQVAALAENLGRSVFSAQESETLGKIQSLGALSDEKLEAIRESNRGVIDALNLYKELNQEAPAPEPFGEAGIQSEGGLMDIFTSIDVSTQGMSLDLKTKDGDRLIMFSQASYKDYKLQGTFQVENQTFSFLKLGAVTENRAPLSSLEGFLIRLVSENKKLEESGKTVVEDTGPNNYTTTAILTRSNILKLLESENVTVSLDNILLTDAKLSQARVEKASFKKQYLLAFDFDLGPPIRIRNMSVQYGRNTVLLPGQIFKLQTLAEDLEAAIELKLTDTDFPQ